MGAEQQRGREKGGEGRKRERERERGQRDQTERRKERKQRREGLKRNKKPPDAQNVHRISASMTYILMEPYFVIGYALN